MTKIIQKDKFKNIECQFQKNLNEDIKSINSDNRLFVKADKSTNFYKLETTKYNQLLHDNITKTYKKAETTNLRQLKTRRKQSPSNSVLTTVLKRLPQKKLLSP